MHSTAGITTQNARETAQNLDRFFVGHPPRHSQYSCRQYIYSNKTTLPPKKKEHTSIYLLKLFTIYD